MKILLLHDYGTATGGAELQVLSLRRDLILRGHEVRLFTSRAKQLGDYPLLSDYSCFGSTSKLRVLAQTANISAYYQLKKILKEFNPDVVHIRMFLTQLSPLVLPLLRNIPCVYQTAVYNSICPVGTNLLPDGQPCRHQPGQICRSSGCLSVKAWMALMMQQKLWQKWQSSIDRVVALSHAMKEELEQAGIQPIDVIHNGVPIRSRRPPLQSPPTAAYAGRLVPEKGVDILLKAFAIAKAKVPSAKLLIAGQGSAEADLKALAAALNIAEDVTWMGHLPPEALEVCLNQSWVQVVSSLWAEPFGNVTTEAMMRGTAVIASAVGAQPEIVRDGITGFLVSAGDANALSIRLIQLLLDRTLAEKMGAAGRDCALSQFNESRRTEKFLALYEHLLTRYSKDVSLAGQLRVTSL